MRCDSAQFCEHIRTYTVQYMDVGSCGCIRMCVCVCHLNPLVQVVANTDSLVFREKRVEDHVEVKLPCSL